MFNAKTKESSAIASQGKTSIVGTGMAITGDILTDADIRIDGKLIGTITSTAKVVIGSEGMVEGNITALQADITGKVTGNLYIKEVLNLRENAALAGDVTAGKISMEPTVVFNGKCTMTVSSTQVVEMVKDIHERKAAAE